MRKRDRFFEKVDSRNLSPPRGEIECVFAGAATYDENRANNQVVSLNSEQRAAWRAAMQPLWQDYEGKIGSDVLRAAQTVNRR